MLTRLTPFVPAFDAVMEDPADRYPQAERDPVDDDIMLAAIRGDGVISGCEVTPSDPPGPTVDLAAGLISVGGSIVTVGAQPEIVVPTANATQRRFDLLAIDDDGVGSAVQGSPADAGPPFPQIPASSVIASSIYLTPALTAIAEQHLIDKRCEVSLPAASTASGWTPVIAHEDAPRNNRATLLDDEELFFTMAADTNYQIRAMILISSLTASDWRIGWNGPTSPALILGRRSTYPFTSLGNTAPVEGAITGYETSGFSDPTAPQGGIITHFDLHIRNGSSAGAFHFSHAQRVAVADNGANRRAGSWLEYRTV